MRQGTPPRGWHSLKSQFVHWFRPGQSGPRLLSRPDKSPGRLGLPRFKLASSITHHTFVSVHLVLHCALDTAVSRTPSLPRRSRSWTQNRCLYKLKCCCYDGARAGMTRSPGEGWLTAGGIRDIPERGCQAWACEDSEALKCCAFLAVVNTR